MFRTDYRELILSGGGTKGLLMLGALAHLQSRGCLDHVHRYVGASVGSIVALLLAVGYGAHDVFNVLLNVEFKRLFRLDVDNLFRLKGDRSYGLCDNRPLAAVLGEMLAHKGLSPTITFQALRVHTGKSLNLVAYNLSHMKHHAFSHRTSPDVSVVRACLASASIPVVFPPMTFPSHTKNDLYIDGGVLESLPQRFAKYRTRSLRVYIVTREINLPLQIKTFMDYLSSVVLCIAARVNNAATLLNHCEKGSRRASRRRGKNNEPRSRLLKLSSRDARASWLDLSMSREAKHQLFEDGVACAENNGRTTNGSRAGAEVG